MSLREKLQELGIKTNKDLEQWSDKVRNPARSRYSFFVSYFGQYDADRLMTRLSQIECDIFTPEYKAAR